ncbi:MAG: InlB B-repeat-containing protein, partial [Acholeplasmataceae bacterium]
MKIKTILIVILFLLFLGGCQINEEYTVHFDSQGGTPISSITIFEDGTLALPNPPTKIGHTFDGWYLDMDFNDEYSIENTIESDITLYAYWIPIEYLITFESNGGTSVADQKVEYGKFLNQPIIDKENFELVGWYLDDDFDTPFDFSEPISTDVILYAK